MKIYGELRKVSENDDGTLTVHGIASSGNRDSAGEIVTPAAMRDALPSYLQYPTIRTMHQPIPAGTATKVWVDADGFTNLEALIVDTDAIRKTRAAVYRGFSIGGKVLERDKTDPTVITKIRLQEISLVDRPANEDAAITLFKLYELPDEPPAQRDPVADLKAVLAKAKLVLAESERERNLAKVADETPEEPTADDVRKALAGSPSLLQAFEKLMAEPLPPKAATSNLAGSHALAKTDDARGHGDDMAKATPQAAFASLSDEDRTTALMRTALSKPVAISR